MKTTQPQDKVIEAWDYFQFADGSVRMTKLRWLLPAGFGERRCLGPVEGTASPLDMHEEFLKAAAR